ncbi:hypothetical protein U5897_19765 [Acinetobacter baumannii]|nr:hypothetical protein [Acinetobacter baumannii]WSI13512.1 hypothetical protein U5897_19765 [Acinetobacter baumannii]
MNMDIYSATPPVAKKRRKYSMLYFRRFLATGGVAEYISMFMD